MKYIIPLLFVFLLASCGSVANHTQTQSGTPTLEESEQKAFFLVPKNPEDYRQKMTEYAQVGGENPFSKIELEKKPIALSGSDTMLGQMIALRTARSIYVAGGGPKSVELVSFGVKEGTAYVLFNFDTDGWAGVSATIAMIHPLVEKAILDNKIATQVRFEAVPKN